MVEGQIIISNETKEAADWVFGILKKADVFKEPVAAGWIKHQLELAIHFQANPLHEKILHQVEQISTMLRTIGDLERKGISLQEDLKDHKIKASNALNMCNGYFDSILGGIHKNGSFMNTGNFIERVQDQVTEELKYFEIKYNTDEEHVR